VSVVLQFTGFCCAVFLKADARAEPEVVRFPHLNGFKGGGSIAVRDDSSLMSGMHSSQAVH